MRIQKIADEVIAGRSSTPKSSPPPRSSSDKKSLWDSPATTGPPPKAAPRKSVSFAAEPLVEQPNYSSKYSDQSELTVNLLDEPGSSKKQVDYDDDSQCASQCKNICIVS